MQPKRAYHFTLVLDADSKEELVSAMENLIIMIDREEITTGCSGASNSGYIYELLVNKEQTHEKYFQDIKLALIEKNHALNF